MGYRHIDFEERCAIARLHKEGATIREIAAALDRSPPTISREIKCNSGSAGEYKPAAADEKARAQRWRGSRLGRDDLLREAVLRRMEWGSSPPQVAGRLALEMGRPALSHERSTGSSPRRREDEGLRLAELPAEEEGEEWDALAQGPELRRVHQRPAPAVGAACGGRRPGRVRALGGGHDAVRREEAGAADPARAASRLTLARGRRTRARRRRRGRWWR